MPISNAQFYGIYSDNLRLLEREMELIKKTIQQSLGEQGYLKENGRNVSSLDYDIKAGMRIYGFLMCSWFEARFHKILYENSNEAFTDTERTTMKNYKVGQKWREGFHIAICKKYGFSYSQNTDYRTYFTDIINQRNYITVKTLIDEIDSAITVRNRLAHGQWETQFNSENTAISNDIKIFFQTYDNIQKLNYLFQIYKSIAEIIADAIVSKDTYERDFDVKMQKIMRARMEIDHRSFERYCKPFVEKEKKKHESLSTLSRS